jgi:hypothetical protein
MRSPTRQRVIPAGNLASLSGSANGAVTAIGAILPTAFGPARLFPEGDFLVSSITATSAIAAVDHGTPGVAP